NSIEYARARELFVAARDHGINTLIYGKTFNLADELVPAMNGKPNVVYFKNKEKFLNSLERRILPGEGSSQACPAQKPPTLCGVLSVKGKKKWCAYHENLKTLCYYSSAKKPFPDGMIYLESFTIILQKEVEDFDSPGSLFSIES